MNEIDAALSDIRKLLAENKIDEFVDSVAKKVEEKPIIVIKVYNKHTGKRIGLCVSNNVELNIHNPVETIHNDKGGVDYRMLRPDHHIKLTGVVLDRHYTCIWPYQGVVSVFTDILHNYAKLYKYYNDKKVLVCNIDEPVFESYTSCKNTDSLTVAGKFVYRYDEMKLRPGDIKFSNKETKYEKIPKIIDDLAKELVAKPISGQH